jgi:hypothetical protein
MDSSVSRKLVDLIERSAHDLTMRCLDDMQNHPCCPTYRTYNRDELYKRIYEVYRRLGKWISRRTTKDEIAAHYTALGRQRRGEGFALSEVIMALILIRRRMWLKVLSEGFIDSALDLNLALELSNRVILFFDRASYYASLGYERG